MKKRIYLDYATTTPLDAAVERAMKPFARKVFGNPESLHKEGLAAAKALIESRVCVARLIQAHANEIYFTSGGTESNNLAVMGYLRSLERQGMRPYDMHVIVSTIEHSSVLMCAGELEQKGVKVSFLPVDKEGLVSAVTLEKIITDKTVLVSVMHANNEIGTVQPIEKISSLLKRINRNRQLPIRLHTDACQSALYLPIDQNRLGADFISFDGHKMYGPRGIGALYIRSGASISPLFLGGGQESGKRPGTVPIYLIAGFSRAFSLARERQKKESTRLVFLRDFFIGELRHSIPEVLLNGSAVERLPNNINVAIPGLNAEFAVLQLDALGIACSAKSACLEHERESYVIKALGRNDGSERSSLRFTLGHETTKNEIKSVIRMFPDVVRMQKKQKMMY